MSSFKRGSRSGRVAPDPLDPRAIGGDVVAVDARFPGALDLVHFPVVLRPGHRLGFDRSLALEGMRLVGVAVIPVNRPIQAGTTGRTKQEQGQAAIVAHEELPRIQRAIPSRKVPTVIAAVSSFHCCTGTLPIVSPVRPLTAM